MKRWSFFVSLCTTFFFIATTPFPVGSEGVVRGPMSQRGQKRKPKENTSLDREKERLRASIKKKETFKDLVDRREEYLRFFALFYRDDVAIDKEERIFLKFKRAELELEDQDVRRLEAQVVADGHKILSMEEDREKE